MFKKIMFILVMAAISGYSFSANEAIPKDRTIEEFIVYDNLVVIKFSPDFSNSQGCSSTSQSFLQLDYDDMTGKNKALFSTLLAAYMSSKKVGFGISGCAGQYPKIYRVDVIN